MPATIDSSDDSEPDVSPEHLCSLRFAHQTDEAHAGRRKRPPTAISRTLSEYHETIGDLNTVIRESTFHEEVRKGRQDRWEGVKAGNSANAAAAKVVTADEVSE